MKKFAVTVNGNQFDVGFDSNGKLFIDKNAIDFAIREMFEEIYQIKLEQKVYNAWVERIDQTHFQIWIDHYIFEINVEDYKSSILKPFSKSSATALKESIVRAPMPGLISKIEVKIGDDVSPGSGLIVLEAMKMENEIHSTVQGKIQSIEIKDHMTVDKNQILLVIKLNN